MLRISLWNLDGDLGIWRVENSYSNSQITEGFWEFELRCQRGPYANLALLHVVVRRVPEHARFERDLLLRTLSRSTGKLGRARSRLYRSQILQQNLRLKALAEIYTMHSFAPFAMLKIFFKTR